MKKSKSKSKPKAKAKPKIHRAAPAVLQKAGISPLGSRVLIRPFTKEELMKKNSFGIILPEADSKEKSEQGTVIAVGPGDVQDGKRIPVGVKVGDKVAFSKYGYEDLTVNGEEFYLIKEENILAILK